MIPTEMNMSSTNTETSGGPAPKFRPYEVRDSGKCVEEIWDLVNATVFYGHCQPDSVVKIDAQKAYGDLLDALNEAGIETRTFAEIDFSEPPPADKVTGMMSTSIL
ncbi:MAG: hypothetical protein WD342_00760 [Verrucomicrobiales bacterium]